MALLLTGLGSVLYDLQINNGELAYRRQSQYKIAETETVEAGRGQILDRNGRVLVSDQGGVSGETEHLPYGQGPGAQ